MINMWYLLNPALQLHEKKLFLHSWSIQSISRKYFMFNLALLWNTPIYCTIQKFSLVIFYKDKFFITVASNMELYRYTVFCIFMIFMGYSASCLCGPLINIKIKAKLPIG